MPGTETRGLNEHRIAAEGTDFDRALDAQVRQALEHSQVLDPGAAPQEGGNLLQAAMRVKNMRRLREQEEAGLREMEAQVRAEALATVKLRQQAAELAGVEARAKNIARVRAETVARLAELEQQIRDDALATVALRQEIARRQAQADDQAARHEFVAVTADVMPADGVAPTEQPVAPVHDVREVAAGRRRWGQATFAWGGWGVAALLLGLWWGKAAMAPPPAPVAALPALPTAEMRALPQLPMPDETGLALKLETELHAPPH